MLSLISLKNLSLSEIIQKTNSEDLCIQQLRELKFDIDNLLLHNREQREINSKLKFDIPILKQKNEVLLNQYEQVTEKANQRESRIAERKQAQRESERQEAQREAERQEAQRETERQEAQREAERQEAQREAERQEAQSQETRREAEHQESKKVYECVRPVGKGITMKEFNKRRVFSCDPVNIPANETIDNDITIDDDGNIGGTFERKQICSTKCLVNNDEDPSITDDIKAADEEMNFIDGIIDHNNQLESEINTARIDNQPPPDEHLSQVPALSRRTQEILTELIEYNKNAKIDLEQKELKQAEDKRNGIVFTKEQRKQNRVNRTESTNPPRRPPRESESTNPPRRPPRESESTNPFRRPPRESESTNPFTTNRAEESTRVPPPFDPQTFRGAGRRGRHSQPQQQQPQQQSRRSSTGQTNRDHQPGPNSSRVNNERNRARMRRDEEIRRQQRGL